MLSIALFGMLFGPLLFGVLRSVLYFYGLSLSRSLFSELCRSVLSLPALSPFWHDHNHIAIPNLECRYGIDREVGL